MKKFLSMLLMAAGLMSCGDDDKPFIPELNKLTSVTCTKNGNAFFNANIGGKTKSTTSYLMGETA